MSELPVPRTQNQETAVDDVRRVRERLSREAGGDLRKLAEESTHAAEALREKLGLKQVAPSGPPEAPATAGPTETR